MFTSVDTISKVDAETSRFYACIAETLPAITGSFKPRPNIYSMEINEWNTPGICVSIITQPCSDRVTQHNAGGTVEITSCTSAVSGLISFPHSPFPPPQGSCVSGDTAYKGLSAFIMSGMNREYMEKLSLFNSGAHVCRLPLTIAFTQQQWLLLARDCILCAGCCACRFWQVNYQACTWHSCWGYLLSLFGIINKHTHTHTHTHNHFTALFPGPSRWAAARRELLDFMVQGEINRGRHTDHLAGCHSIQTNQCAPPPSPILFTVRMPFLPPNQQWQSTEGKIINTIIQ